MKAHPVVVQGIAVATERGGILYLQRSDMTVQGIPILAAEDVEILRETERDRLGAAVLAMLRRSRVGLPALTGRQIDSLPSDPLPALAGVQSEAEFLVGASVASINLRSDGTIEIRRTDEGSQASGRSTPQVLSQPSERILGEALLALLTTGY